MTESQSPTGPDTVIDRYSGLARTALAPVELMAGFAALAGLVRVRLIGVLAGGGRCVCDLQEQVPVAPNLLSYHLRVLREAGLVTASRLDNRPGGGVGGQGLSRTRPNAWRLSM